MQGAPIFEPVNDLGSRAAAVQSLRQYIARTDQLRPPIGLRDRGRVLLVHDAFLCLRDATENVWPVHLAHLNAMLTRHAAMFLHPCEFHARERLLTLLAYLRGEEFPPTGPSRHWFTYQVSVNGTIESHTSARYVSRQACEMNCRCETESRPDGRTATHVTLHTLEEDGAVEDTVLAQD